MQGASVTQAPQGTKAAVVYMTRAFAKECVPLGIRVNALLPGLTKTKFAGALFADQAMYESWIGRRRRTGARTGF
ncbi:enoyl-ACP reductase-like protein [Paraburkholderia sp. BL25I1N1]|nr:enoyl-ACP reductase-like protein [Paraburkholderia sp. BL25I1N1]